MTGRKAITIAVLAGASHSAIAQTPGLRISADKTSASIDEQIIWTLTVTNMDAIGTPLFVQAYDLNILASDDTLADATPFADALSPIVSPSPGSAIDASLFGVSGGQSRLLDPLGLQVDGPTAIGSFTTTARRAGSLSYTVEDGGALGADVLRLDWNFTYLGPIPWNGPPDVASDTVTIVPAPASPLLLLGLTLGGRRRR